MDLYCSGGSAVCGVDPRATDLVHACIGEEPGGVIEGDRWGRGDEGVVLLPEEVEELLPDGARCPFSCVLGHVAVGDKERQWP